MIYDFVVHAHRITVTTEERHAEIVQKSHETDTNLFMQYSGTDKEGIWG